MSQTGHGDLGSLPLSVLWYGTRGFVYKTFCVDSLGNEGGGETTSEGAKSKRAAICNWENPLRFMSVFTIPPPALLLKEGPHGE